SRIRRKLAGTEVGESAHENARHDQQRQRKRHLRRHQNLAKSGAVPIAARAIGAGLECDREIAASGLHRGYESEQQSREQRDREREEQSAPIRMQVDREVDVALGKESEERDRGPIGDNQPKRSSE